MAGLGGKLKDPISLKQLIEQSKARYEAMAPVEKAIHDMEQKRSGIIGLSKMSTPREVIEAHIDAMPEFVILAELKRLRAKAEANS